MEKKGEREEKKEGHRKRQRDTQKDNKQNVF